MYRQLTVGETLDFFAQAKGMPKAGRREEILCCLQMVHLEDREKSRMGTLSGGMVRRVGIAQALLGRPQLLIFDEPTAGLDPEERRRFKALAASLNGCTVLISTHIVEDVEEICGRIILLNGGRVICEGTGSELIAGADGAKTLEEAYLYYMRED